MQQENPTFSHEFAGFFDVALFEPDIPLNTGSVARTCACTGSPLHIVGPAGFRLDDRLARRAGLDYWELAEVHIHRTWEEFRDKMPGKRMWLFSTKGAKAYWEVEYRPGDVLVFGSETSGLPGRILESGAGEILRIPLVEGMRSLNLSNAVAIALYEALRQASTG
jgi:tRNA (cytidine/uridine-2'-O-)-methyltransferase